jgi:hypothetical protein
MNKFDKNIERLSFIDKEYSERIKDAECPEWLDVRGNDFFIKRGGKIHKGERKDWINEEKKILTNKKMLSEDLSVFIGIGFGEVLKHACKIKEDRHFIIIVEPVDYLVRVAFERYDFSHAMKKKNLIIINPEPEKIKLLFNNFDANVVVQHINLYTNSYAMHIADIYSETTNLVSDIVNQMQCNIGTVMGAGSIIAENDIKNLPYILRHRGVIELKDAYKNHPCVIVSTGPSLQKNIHILHELQHKVIIIAVAQALRALLAYEIKPDFVCTVDYGEVNAEHFEGLYDCGVPLVALNRSYAGIIKKWRGPKFISVSANPGYKGTITELIQQKGTLIQGGSVSHLCLGLAIALGCRSATLIGQDLSYEGNKSHIPLADASGDVDIKDNIITWKVTDPNSTLKNKLNVMGLTKYVPGYLQEVIVTNIGLASFITSFENIATLNVKIKLYNSTEGGASIKGFENISLRKYIKGQGLYFRKKNRIENLCTLVDNSIELIDEAMPLLKKDIKIFNEIIENCKLALSANKKMAKKSVIRDKQKLRLLLKENEVHSKKAEQLSKLNPLVQLSIYKQSREIQSRELKVKCKMNHLLSDNTDLKTRLKRNRIIIEAARDASESLIEIYEKAYDVLKEYTEAGDEGLLQDLEKIVPKVEGLSDYLDKGNWAYPLLVCQELIENKWIVGREREKILDIGDSCNRQRCNAISKAEESYDQREKEIDYINLIRKSREIDMNQKGFKKAYNLIKEANQIFPDKFEAKWGLATLSHHFKRYKKSLELYDQLIEEYPDVNKLKFERSLVMLSIDRDKGLELMGKILEETEEFDHYLAEFGKMQEKAGNIIAAKTLYEHYLEKYPDNIEVKEKLKELKCRK